MNNVNIIGRIVNDLELKKVGQEDITLLNFTIAYNDKQRNREESYFFDIVSWGKQAETIANYFRKGQRIGLGGRLKQERFQDKEGKNRSRVVIILRDFTFIESKNNSGESPGNFNSSKDNNDQSNFDDFNPDNINDEVPF